ncbi:MAG TPA: hypothetical protein EYH42_07085 [Sulfurovum sp.]|nr:hypothetical protein [Sulfurovum sp.]
MNKLLNREGIVVNAMHNKNCTSTKGTHNTRKSTLTIEIFSEDCGCKEIILDTDNCNGEDMAQVNIALSETLAPLVGAECTDDILCDLLRREKGGTL